VRLRLAPALVFAVVGCNDPTGPETEISGKVLYDQYCARCHGPDGGGAPDYPPAAGKLNNPGRMKGLSDEAIMGIIRAGRPGPQPGSPPAMPSFANEFTDAKIMVITAYVRTLAASSEKE
jgi:mono/diheme cytochrome c family protein